MSESPMLETGEERRYVSRAALIALVGMDAAERVVAAFGGSRTYIPEPSAPEFTGFAAQLGSPDAAQALAVRFGGGRITLPVRLASKAKESEIIALRASLSVPKLARKLRITERYAYRVLARARDGGQ